MTDRLLLFESGPWKAQKTVIQKLSALLSLIGVIVAWVLFAPTQVGGAASFVIVNGNSMEPVYYRGDLVILRTADAYTVGDIVTYQHPTIGQIIHRIIDKDGDTFVFKGDNNDFIDSYQPVQSELVGRAWIHLSGAGDMVKQIRQPWVIALVAGLIGLIVVAPSAGNMSTTQSSRRRKQTQRQKGRQSASPALIKSEDFALVMGIVAVLSLVLGIFAFTRPTTQTVADTIPYSHEGSFSYTAAAPPGLYSNDTVQSGEPIFRRLISQVEFGFAYRLAADKTENLTGTGRMQAIVSANNGWQWTFDMQPETAFSGDNLNLRGVLDLAEVQTVLDSMQQQSGVRFQSFTLAIIPTVSVAGNLDGEPLDARFEPSLTFQLDDLQMRLADDIQTDDADPLRFSQSNTIPHPQVTSNTLSILGIKLDVAKARTVALAGLAFGGIGLLISALFNIMAGAQGEPVRIQARYAPLLVSVHDINLGEGSRVASVASVDDLVKVAERSGSMILHEANGPVHTYYVQMDQLVYRYQTTDTESVELQRQQQDDTL